MRPYYDHLFPWVIFRPPPPPRHHFKESHEDLSEQKTSSHISCCSFVRDFKWLAFRSPYVAGNLSKAYSITCIGDTCANHLELTGKKLSCFKLIKCRFVNLLLKKLSKKNLKGSAC
jgi:hypothetical protein